MCSFSSRAFPRGPKLCRATTRTRGRRAETRGPRRGASCRGGTRTGLRSLAAMRRVAAAAPVSPHDSAFRRTGARFRASCLFPVHAHDITRPPPRQRPIGESARDPPYEVEIRSSPATSRTDARRSGSQTVRRLDESSTGVCGTARPSNARPRRTLCPLPHPRIGSGSGAPACPRRNRSRPTLVQDPSTSVPAASKESRRLPTKPASQIVTPVLGGFQSARIAVDQRFRSRRITSGSRIRRRFYLTSTLAHHLALIGMFDR